MKRLINIIGLVLTTALLSVGVASAATLVFTTGKLGAGRATVTACATSPLQAMRNVDDSGDVTQVTVLNVPQACSGERLAVTLRKSGGASLFGASTVVGTCSGGCTVTFNVPGTVSAANVAAFAFSLTQ